MLCYVGGRPSDRLMADAFAESEEKEPFTEVRDIEDVIHDIAEIAMSIQKED